MMMRTNSIVYLKTDRWLPLMFLISFLCKEEEGTKENKQKQNKTNTSSTSSSNKTNTTDLWECTGFYVVCTITVNVLCLCASRIRARNLIVGVENTLPTKKTKHIDNTHIFFVGFQRQPQPPQKTNARYTQNTRNSQNTRYTIIIDIGIHM